MKQFKVMQAGIALAVLFLLLIGVVTIKAASNTDGIQAAFTSYSTQAASTNPVKATGISGPFSWRAEHADTSPPLRDIPIKRNQTQRFEDNDNPAIPAKGRFGAVDTAVQSLVGPLVMPTPIANFEGMYNQYGPVPPDTNGDVGRNHYVQIVNSGFQVWSKTGTPIYGPANNNTLFAGFGGPCEARNDGDPVALYDAMADRWVLTWFTSGAPYMECIAVSAGPDPTGAWYRYAFLDNNSGTTLGDYPKMSVWPDAYYMTTNEFAPSFVGDGNYAYNRAKMLRGDPSAELVYFHGSDGGKLPSDVDSAGAPPPAGSPNYIMEWFNGTPGQLAEYKFHVDFATPANSTYLGPFLISVTDFNPNAPAVPQLGTTTLLDNLSDRFMFRLAYRNMGSYEAIVVNHTVNVSGVDGIRWYELRDPNNALGASVFQQGTYAPADGIYRWMGSIAMDKLGDIAVGFSVSNASMYPGIRYAGRLVGDPLGQLSQGEATLLDGTGSEDYPAVHRWGDYSAINVDPVDDCTFWYTTMYFSQTSLRAWRTRIGSFKFPGCTAAGTPTPVASATAPLPTNTPVLPTPTLCAGSMSATGSITNTDPMQTGRLGLNDPKSSCVATRPLPATSDTLTRHYDTYSYTNSTGSAQCVTVSIAQACGNNAIQSVTYLGSFDPNSINTNYLAHGGASGAHFSYSFSLPAGQTAVVVVLEVSPNIGCSTYDISINPCAQGAITPSPTSPPPSTPSNTPVVTPSPTPTTVCTGITYQVFPSTGATMLPATDDIGNHDDDVTTSITLPFAVNVYTGTYTNANVGSNGNIQFTTNNPNYYGVRCMPITGGSGGYGTALFPYYDDLMTIMTGTNTCPGCGIYSNTIGTAPNRQFVLRWNTTYFRHDGETNFEVVFNENSPTISYIYGTIADNGADATSGVQRNLGQYTQYSCQSPLLTSGKRVDFVPIGCDITPTVTPPAATSTPTATATSTVCPITFTDVPQGSTFYDFIRCLACRGIINGYSDGTFRPNNNVTRGQLSKIVSNSAGFSDPQTTQMFQDVAPGSTFFDFIGRLASRGYISGYPCGGAGEPCVPPDNLPYFRTNNNATRGQISKIVSNAAGFIDPAVGQTFQDVPPGSTFYDFIERLASRGVMSGYPCGQLPNEPCVPPDNRPYFRPNNNATRGQTSKIVANTFFPACVTPSRR